MKKLLTLALGVVMLAALTGLSAAEERGKGVLAPTPLPTPERKAEEKGKDTSERAGGCCCTMWDSKDPEHCIQTTCPCPPGGGAARMSQPATGEKKMDKASPQLMKVKVLKVNESAKTFTVMVKGKEKTLNAPDLKSLPKAGDIIEIAVSDAGGGCTDWYDQHAHLHHCSSGGG